MLKSKAEVFFDLYRRRQEVAIQRDELKLANEENARLLKESRLQAEALKAADQRKDEFLAMLAHELRNPMAPIRNAVEILRIAQASGDDAENAREIISRQVSHMTRLIDDLLDVARIARGKVQLRTESCDLTAIVRQTAEDYRPTLSAAGLSLELALPDEPLTLTGDATRLAQVVGNLLHNAGKFTARGGRVFVRAEADHRRRLATVSVQDSGVGLDRVVLSRLFEPFSQAMQSSGREKGGLGLGLALTKGLTELHGGAVTAESAGHGQGATFTIQLPLAAASGAVRPSAADQAPASESIPRKILIVEDNQDAAHSLQTLLSFLGHEVEVAFDGDSGLAAARRLQPQIVVSDLGLPGEIDGYAIARTLRGDPAFANVHLIALSGYGQEDNRRRSREAGFDQHLVKPVDLERLTAALAAAPCH